jgi:SAM-dependent methyltransferase
MLNNEQGNKTMEKHLEMIAKSYDRHFIDYGKKDALLYDNLPDYITNNPVVLKAIQEFHRVMKPGGRLVLDISNITSPSGRMAMLIEEYMGKLDNKAT